MNKHAPIGIFDSGIGGLTVAKAVKDLLPKEHIVYYGDTKHLPYGDKSAQTVIDYSLKITKFLLSKGCKCILIACNSASAAAYESVLELVDGRALVFNVIDPVVNYLDSNFNNKKVGLIGTKQTINSGVYKVKLGEKNKQIVLKSLATPLLAHLIEEGFYGNNVSNEIIKEYLSSEELKDIEGLILGCTHYPLVKEQISLFYNNEKTIIDSSEIVAKQVKEVLVKNSLLNDANVSEEHFFVSDYTKSFEESTKIFFGTKLNLERV